MRTAGEGSGSRLNRLNWLPFKSALTEVQSHAPKGVSYSHRSATMGSIFATRRAGTAHEDAYGERQIAGVQSCVLVVPRNSFIDGGCSRYGVSKIVALYNIYNMTL
jgi:hypothetical protein